MPGYNGYIEHAQSALEQPSGGLVAQIVELQAQEHPGIRLGPCGLALRFVV